MHELSIAQSLLAIVLEEKTNRGLEKITKVIVRNGALAGIVADSLLFSWESLTMETELAGAELEILEIPIKVECGSCGKDFYPEDNRYMPCPDCGLEIGHKVLEGKELYIESIEAAQPEGA